jgi:hypothetical protein
VALTDDFFRPWEREIGSLGDMTRVLRELHDSLVVQKRNFAWRGVVDASWPLHSSLYRRVLWTRDGLADASGQERPPAPDERDLARQERELLARVHRWELHWSSSGRLPILAQLATLQHFGAPTRLVDVSLNPYIALWFAVEQKFVNGSEAYSDVDGRLYAIDITRRLINESDARRSWEDDLHRPWKGLPTEEWSSSTWAWRPAAFEARIASQHGAFVFGGVPRTGLGVVWPKTTRADGPLWKIDEVRRCISFPLRLHKALRQGGGVGDDAQPAYTYRIKSEAKGAIRAWLEEMFGYSHLTMYPDYPGFAQFGMPHLREQPPRRIS